jgi:hypothetical protein
VTDATHYKVFLQQTNNTYLNKHTVKATTVLDYNLAGNMFISDTNIYFPRTSYRHVSDGNVYYYYVFAYKNGIRSSFPATCVYYDNTTTLQLLPVQQLEYIGGSNYASFLNVTARNLYTNKSYIMSSNEWVSRDLTNVGTVKLTEIETNVPISNK